MQLCDRTQSSDAATEGAGSAGVGAGSGVGSVIGFSVSEQGLITGTFTNGRSQALGQIALATFANPNGLTKEGSSLYGATVNSGNPQSFDFVGPERKGAFAGRLHILAGFKIERATAVVGFFDQPLNDWTQLTGVGFP